MGPFPRYWPFMRGIHRSHRPVRFDVLFDSTNKRLNKQSGDLRRHRTHYHVTIIKSIHVDSPPNQWIIPGESHRRVYKTLVYVSHVPWDFVTAISKYDYIWRVGDKCLVATAICTEQDIDHMSMSCQWKLNLISLNFVRIFHNKRKNVGQRLLAHNSKKCQRPHIMTIRNDKPLLRSFLNQFKDISLSVSRWFINSSPPGAAYMRQWTGRALV